MPGHSRKTEIKPSLKGIARALNNSKDVVEEPLPDKLAALSERLTEAGHQDEQNRSAALGAFRQPSAVQRALLNDKS
jgi:hypothetical protein